MGSFTIEEETFFTPANVIVTSFLLLIAFLLGILV